jgi:hypothetical protein
MDRGAWRGERGFLQRAKWRERRAGLTVTRTLRTSFPTVDELPAHTATASADATYAMPHAVRTKNAKASRALAFITAMVSARTAGTRRMRVLDLDHCGTLAFRDERTRLSDRLIDAREAHTRP